MSDVTRVGKGQLAEMAREAPQPSAEFRAAIEEQRRPSYAELEAIIAQVRAFAHVPDATSEDGFGKGFAAGDASCRRGLRAIPGIGE